MPNYPFPQFTAPKSRRLASIVAAITMLAAAGTAAATDSAIAATSVRIGYSPSAIETEAGAEALYARITRAARRVCGPVDARDLRTQIAARECLEIAIENALEQTGSGKLTAMHRERGEDSSIRLAAGS